jgi:hypothetical protein
MPRRPTSFFSPEARNLARDRVLELANTDERVVAGAVVGSLALGEGDRWSDLDLTFAVRDGQSVEDVLDDWTRTLADELEAVHLFDVWGGGALYRVFLLPGCLQLDVSVAPESSFGARTPRFRLLFGAAAELPQASPPPAAELFGYAVHHALRARFAIERGQHWLAEYWVGQVRDYALALACLRRGLPTSHGRGFDELPADVLAAFAGALPRSLDRDELLRALAVAVEGLIQESAELADPVEQQLRALA